MSKFVTRGGLIYFSDRAPYIVIEGSDGTGKSLQANRLIDHLKQLGFDPLVVPNPDKPGEFEPIQEPGGTEYANGLREILKYSDKPLSAWDEVDLFTKARKSNWEELIDSALNNGRPVVTSRNYISTVAYQGHGKGVAIDKILKHTEKEVGKTYMNPDVMFILALADETTRKERLSTRGIEKKDRFESPAEDFQKRVQAGYLDFAAQQNIPVLPADGTPEEIEEMIWSGNLKTISGVRWHGIRHLFDLDA